MYKINCVIFALTALISTDAGAREFSGKVFSIENDKKTPVVGATVYAGKNSTATDAGGYFNLDFNEGDGRWIYASFTGYTTDSLPVTETVRELEFILKEGVKLDEVLVETNQKGINFNRLDVGRIERITKTGLVKMACCNLSESFENSATVTVGFTDAVSGTKQIQLLGLPGLYSQLLNENIPVWRGLLSSFGWSYVPGSWMESIQVSKGASSVVNGYESVTGQINAEIKKPNYTEPLFINLYADQLGRYEGNITTASEISKELYHGTEVHFSTETGGVAGDKYHDRNEDGFLDMPHSKLVNVYDRWFYLSESGIQSRTGFRYLYDSRDAGQGEHAHQADSNGSGTAGQDEHSHLADNSGTHELYTTTINNRSFGVENKTGITTDDLGNSIGIISSFNHSSEDLVYGRKTFNGQQNSFYSNILYSNTSNPVHRYTLGASFAFDAYRTWYEDRLESPWLETLPEIQTPRTDFDRNEAIPGAFAEYTFAPDNKFTFVAGLREDWNSRFGWLFTPRASARYSPITELVFRASAGRGYRSPNAIADNIGLLASSRRFEVDGINSLDIERAWNYGGNITGYIPVWDERTLIVSIDYFHTDFDNQAIIDIERNSRNVFFYNLQGKSYADAVQADLSFTPFDGFDVFAAFRYNRADVTYTSPDGVNYTFERPLMSRYRGLLNLAYATGRRAWVFDFTAQVNGPSRLPGLNGYESENKYSQSFPVYFGQVTKNSKRFDVYIGSENLLDFRQKNPVRNWQEPFGQDFDAFSNVWGPIVGRKIYAGIRWRIGKLP
ncbi:MAG: TonB-dependent receptor [Dysgonamonadaceae bacterium]|jgi:outer membrane receptor protein involved in Fe transport|nr:TonB-dependent receptor [Dysgonamonadaceae bacterium]